LEVVPLTATHDAHPAPTLEALRQSFQTILPRIEAHACIVFRHVKCPHRQADCVQETVGLAWQWFVRLAHRGKDARDFPSALATFAARAVRCGRRVCGQERAKDALSPMAQQRHSFTVTSLPLHSTLSANPFSEALADNTRSAVPDQVAFRCDFPAWLLTLSDRKRRIAKDMALGHRTKELATRHGVTEGRVSQLRRELHRDWLAFHGELLTDPARLTAGVA
jgi:hypothetical protein